jgi:CGNR zinc finger/Putative stress-induced transcription regulator
MVSTRSDEDMLLDLLNTTPVVDGVPQDRLDDPERARSWAREHGGAGSAVESRLIREVRDALQAVVRGERSPGTLTPYLEGVSYVPSLSGEGLDWTLDVPAEREVAARSVLAWSGLDKAGPGRLKPCANTECRLFLIDRSKVGNARWCSMAVCGNRMKARRHYQRAREV